MAEHFIPGHVVSGVLQNSPDFRATAVPLKYTEPKAALVSQVTRRQFIKFKAGRGRV